MIKTISFAITALFFFFSGISCSNSPSRKEALNLLGQGIKGKVYYLRHSLYIHKKIHFTTNYHASELIPINSEIRLLDINNRQLRIDIKGVSRAYIYNDIMYSNQTIGAIFQRTLSETPISLDGLTPLERENVETGKIAPGMTKRAVIMAYGYPPYFKTESIQENEWIYWITRSTKIRVKFTDNGILESIEDY